MATEACGFTTIVIGTFLLHATRELDISLGEPSPFHDLGENKHAVYTLALQGLLQYVSLAQMLVECLNYFSRRCLRLSAWRIH